MKRHLFLVFVISALVFTPFSLVKAASIKIAVVDLNSCLRDSAEGKKLYRQLEKKKDAMQKKMDEKQGELLKMQEDIKKQGMMLSPDARQEKQKILERKQREYKYFIEDLRDDFKRAESELIGKIYQELQEVASDIATKGEYTLILEKRGGVVFNDSAIEITDKVIKAYDKSKK